MTALSSQTALRVDAVRHDPNQASTTRGRLRAVQEVDHPGVQVEVFYDGDCPLCVREIRLLRWLDRHDRIGFVDIAASSFDARTVGRTHEELMARIHGRLPGGELIEGVEVFRRLYAAVGFGPLVGLTRIPGISHLLDAAYRLFARHRLRLTGRCTATTCR